MSKKVCLLIEDDKEDQEFFSLALSGISPETQLVTAEDAETARKILRDEKPPDFIFLDLFLPGIDGYEFLLHIKRDIRHRKIPVIVYSQVDDENQITKTKKFGAADYFTKTPDLESLQALLEKYVLDHSDR